MEQTHGVTGARRITALDGLRGWAALLVVVHHCLMVLPELAQPYFEDRPPQPGWADVLVYSPLHSLWDGPAAVLVFFVLSGFVLTLPFLRPAEPGRWTAYYPARIVRLYLPVFFAVVLAVALALLVPRETSSSASDWLNVHDLPLTAEVIGRDVTLVFGTTWLNSPLWSLRWEVLFSLALPLYLLLATRWRRFMWLKVAALFATIVAAQALDSPALVTPALTYLPVFGLGVLMAVHHRAGRQQPEPHRLPRPAICLASLLFLSADWWLPADVVAVPLKVAAAAALVWLFIDWPAARKAGDGRWAQYLGTRSFSLYLTHEPIVVSVALLLGGLGDSLLVLAIALPVSLLVGELFFRYIERPSHRAARHVGGLAKRLTTADL